MPQMPLNTNAGPVGPDFASVDDNRNVNFAQAYKAGGRFTIMRAVYGRPVKAGTTAPFLDPTWIAYNGSARAAGFRVSAYLFVCYPQKGKFTPGPDEQAQAYIDYVKLTPNVDWIPFFDVEETSDMLSADEMYAWTLRVAKKLWQFYGAWPGMYTSSRVWIENLRNHAAGELIECPLWLAKPWPWAIGSPVHLDGAPGYAPTPIAQWGNQCWIYQYQGDGKGWPGFTSTTDVNRFMTTKRGAKGEQVKWVQRRVGVTVDGDFGPATEAAVKTLQAKHGLSADGIIGPATFAVLGWLLPQ